MAGQATHIIPITVAAQRELSKRGGRDAGARVRVADEAAVATAVEAGVRAGVGGKVAVSAPPNTASLPVVGNSERDLGVRGGGPPCCVGRFDRGRVHVSEHLWYVRYSLAT
jgi:hypothetical protein